MSLFYSYIAGSLHVSDPQAHLQESSYSCSHNHWFSVCTALFACSVCFGHNIQSTRTERHRYWTNGCVNSCTNSPEDGPVGPKHVQIQQYTNKIVTSVGFHSIRCTISRVYWIPLYMFGTVFPSIIRSSRLYIQHHNIQVLWLLASKQPQNLYGVMLSVQSWTSDDGRKDCPKHVEWHPINSRNCASSWFYYRNISRCTVPWTSN